MVEETFEPGMTVSLVARRHGVAPNQLFTWRRLVVEGALTAAGSGEQVVPASDYRALQSQVRESTAARQEDTGADRDGVEQGFIVPAGIVHRGRIRRRHPARRLGELADITQNWL
jgi:transposase-like protein